VVLGLNLSHLLLTVFHHSLKDLLSVRHIVVDQLFVLPYDVLSDCQGLLADVDRLNKHGFGFHFSLSFPKRTFKSKTRLSVVLELCLTKAIVYVNDLYILLSSHENKETRKE